jgi:hypothetical protein
MNDSRLNIISQFGVLGFLLVIILFCGNSCSDNADRVNKLQIANPTSNFAELILSADSIFLIYHSITKEYAPRIGLFNDKEEIIGFSNDSFPSFLILPNEVNPGIILDRIKLSDTRRNDVVRILSNDIDIEDIVSLKCDQPRHAILIYHGKKQSYIDVCFSCLKIHTSDNLKFIGHGIPLSKWKWLRELFVNSNIKEFPDMLSN